MPPGKFCIEVAALDRPVSTPCADKKNKKTKRLVVIDKGFKLNDPQVLKPTRFMELLETTSISVPHGTGLGDKKNEQSICEYYPKHKLS